eukprot:m.485962 g.485962  ORF g.485962 m.485962 type:complete len:210 (+) comp24088_c0_seq1:152-781(+)
MGRPREGKKKGKQEQTVEETVEEEQEETEVIKLDKWDGSAVKNNLDDVFKQAVIDLHPTFHEDTATTDLKLFLSTLACLFALGGCLYGFLVPHPDSSFVVGLCVIGYFGLVTLITLHQNYMDPGYLLISRDNRDEAEFNLLELSVVLPRFHTYVSVDLAYTHKNSGETTVVSRKWCIADFIYESGTLAQDRIHDAIQEMKEEVMEKKQD